VSEEIEALAAEVRRHRRLYYNAVPEISDMEYDALEDRLRTLAPDHPALSEVGAPLEQEKG
jgi:DNA ligase (NAD+)